MVVPDEATIAPDFATISHAAAAIARLRDHLSYCGGNRANFATISHTAAAIARTSRPSLVLRRQSSELRDHYSRRHRNELGDGSRRCRRSLLAQATWALQRLISDP